MFSAKKTWSVLALVLTLGLGTGCDLNTSSDGDDSDVFSYNVDEIAIGYFGNMSPTMTMNDWCLRVTGNRPRTYDQLVQEGFVLYKDKNLKTPFTGSDILDENTVIYSESSINDQDKRIGEITGTITLTDIPHPATKVYIHNSGPYSWIIGKVNMNAANPNGALSWSIPLYERFFTPGFVTGLTLSVLSGDLLYTYTVPVPTQITISGPKTNVGDLGTVSIKGVTLSGMINITYNGEPVPYIEIYANYAVQGTLGIIDLSSPGPNAPWSVTFGLDNNNNKEMTFQVFGYSGKNGAFLFDKYVTVNPPVYVIDNQGVSGIVLDVGDITGP